MIASLSIIQIIGAVILFSAILLTLGGGIVLFIAKRSKKEEYEETNIQERYEQEIVKPLMNDGVNVERKIKQHHQFQGVAMKTLPESKKLKIKENEDGDVKLTDQNFELFEIRKNGTFNKWLFYAGKLFSNERGVNPQATYKAVEEENVSDHQYITIDNGVQFKYVNNIAVPNNAIGMEYRKVKGFENAYDDTLALAANWSEQLHELNIQHVQDVDFLEKKFDIIGDYKANEKKAEREEAMKK